MSDIPIGVGLDPTDAVRGAAVVRQSLNQMGRSAEQAQRSLRQPRDEMGRFVAQAQVMGKSVRDVANDMLFFRRVMIGLFGGFSAAAAIRQLADVETAIQRINSSLGVTFGADAPKAMEFVRSEAHRLGLDLESSATSFGKLQAAAKGTVLEGREAAKVFSAVAEASTALGLSTEQTDGALRALEQMISKGTVQAEELRGQLGERLPGAFQMAAKAMGVTTAQLGKMLEQGQVMASDLLPKLANEMHNRFGQAATDMADGLQANINRMQTSFFNFKDALNKAGGANFLGDMIGGITHVTDSFTAALIATKEFGKGQEEVSFGATEFWKLFADQAIKYLFDIPSALLKITQIASVLVISWAQQFGLQMQSMALISGSVWDEVKGIVQEAFADLIDIAADSLYILARMAERVPFGQALADRLDAASDATQQFADKQHESAAALRANKDEVGRQLEAIDDQIKTLGAAADESVQYYADQYTGAKAARDAAIEQGIAIKSVTADIFKQGEAANSLTTLTKEQTDSFEKLTNRLYGTGAAMQYVREQDLLAKAYDAGKFGAVGSEEAMAGYRDAAERLETEFFKKVQHDAAETAGVINDDLTSAMSDLKSTVVDLAGTFSGAFETMLTGVEQLIEHEEALAASKEETARAQDMLDSAGTDDERKSAMKAINKASMEQQKLIKQNTAMQLNSYAKMTSGAASFFKEGSKGYKALHAASQVFHAFELAMNVQTLIAKLTADEAKVASSMTVAAAEGTANVASSGVGIPFPGNLAAMAATIAVLAGLGVALSGGGGGGVPLSEKRQKKQGRGTVFGDSKAVSASLGNALSDLASLQDDQLHVALDMLRSLRNIEASMVGVTRLVLRNMPTFGKQEWIFGLKEKPQDTGVHFGSQTIGDVLSGGADAQFYADYKHTQDQSVAVSEELREQFTMLFSEIGESVLLAVEGVGGDIDAAREVLEAFEIDIGHISLHGMTGEEAQKAMEAVFSAFADRLSEEVMPAMQEFQQIGEGLFETLIRVGAQTATVRDLFSDLGSSLGGMDFIADARIVDNLVSLAGGFDELLSKFSSFTDSFLTPGQQSTLATNRMTRAFDQLGIAIPATRDAFADLVMSVDVSTEAGQELFTSLLSIVEVADSFYEVIDETAEAMSNLRDVIEGARFDNLLPEQQLEQMLGDYNAAVAAASSMTGADLTNQANVIADLIDPLLAQIADVYASGEYAQMLRELVLSSGEGVLGLLDTVPASAPPMHVTVEGQAESLAELQESNEHLAALVRVQTEAYQRLLEQNEEVIGELREIRERTTLERL